MLRHGPLLADCIDELKLSKYCVANAMIIESSSGDEDYKGDLVAITGDVEHYLHQKIQH